MKILHSLVFGFCLFVAFTVSGQNYTFSVMVNKGSNQVKSGGQWQPLRTGAKLQKADELKVSDNAYIGLLHANGKTIEVRNAGTYKIVDLEKSVPEGNSVAGKYADFLASKMTAEAQKNKLSATGAVHRALGSAGINVYMPEIVQVFRNEAIVRWDPVEAEDITYTVKLMDMFEEVLISEETSETSFKLDFNDERLEGKPYILLVITTSEDETVKSEPYSIKQLPAQEKAQIKGDLAELMSDVNDETAINKYILAGFYEENNLLVDALTSYEEAIALAPEVDTYREAYEEFLLRNGLKSEN